MHASHGCLPKSASKIKFDNKRKWCSPHSHTTSSLDLQKRCTWAVILAREDRTSMDACSNEISCKRSSVLPIDSGNTRLQAFVRCYPVPVDELGLFHTLLWLNGVRSNVVMSREMDRRLLKPINSVTRTCIVYISTYVCNVLVYLEHVCMCKLTIK